MIVGIHNDESYYKLKKKDPIDTVEKRMANVKNFADQVIPSIVECVLTNVDALSSTITLYKLHTVIDVITAPL